MQIVASAFWHRNINGTTGGYEPIPREDVDRLVGVILARAALSVREARHMEKVFRKLQYLKSPKTDVSSDADSPWVP